MRCSCMLQEMRLKVIGLQKALEEEQSCRRRAEHELCSHQAQLAALRYSCFQIFFIFSSHFGQCQFNQISMGNN